MGHSHSHSTPPSALEAIERVRKEKVEKLFRQNNRTSRSRSVDTKATNLIQEKAVRPVGSSQSARYGRAKGPLVPQRTVEGEMGEVSGISAEQKRLIEMCWFKCSQKQLKKTGEQIFLSILNTDKELLTLFKLEGTTPSKLRENAYFRAHAANFAVVLNLVVTNIQENFEQACNALQTLGGQHLSLRSRGFQSLYWDIFTDCFELNHPPSFRSAEEKEAWSRMILFILSQMKKGYERAERAGDTPDRLHVPSL